MLSTEGACARRNADSRTRIGVLRLMGGWGGYPGSAPGLAEKREVVLGTIVPPDKCTPWCCRPYDCSIPACGETEITRERLLLRRARRADSYRLAERHDRRASLEDVIQVADQALYRAKNKGRNQMSR